jgi:hypothetical protein
MLPPLRCIWPFAEIVIPGKSGTPCERMQVVNASARWSWLALAVNCGAFTAVREVPAEAGCVPRRATQAAAAVARTGMPTRRPTCGDCRVWGGTDMVFSFVARRVVVERSQPGRG